MNATVSNSETEILSRSLSLESDDMPPEVAQWMLSHLAFNPDDRARMMDLYGRSVEAGLSAEEDAELTRFANVGRLLDMLKLETLKASSPAPSP
jgi:hypothetical protein